MRTLITGSSGLIGSHLAESLLNEGDSICLVTRRFTPFFEFFKDKLKIVTGDIVEPSFLKEIIIDFKPDRIFHLAAQSFPNKSWEKASETFRVNIEATFNLLSSINCYCPDSIVVIAGSSAEYSNFTQSKKISEESSLNPSNIYGISKLVTYHLGRMLSETNNLNIIHTRPFFIIGPRKNGDVSSDLAKKVIQIENNKLETLKHGNLNSVRDFVDVRDCISALKTLSHRGKHGEVYNICSGNGVKVSKLLDYFKEFSLCDIKTECDHNLFRNVDEYERIGDPSKLKALGWAPKYILSDTCSEILTYWRNQY